jgi:hypothetical protein
MGEVSLMGEIHKVRQALQAYPSNRLLTLPVIEKSLYALLIRVQILMATHAEMEARNAGGRRLVGSAVTIQTIQVELSRMKCMAEGNGLTVLRGGIGAAL